MQYVNNLNTVRTLLNSYELTSHAIHDDFLYHYKEKILCEGYGKDAKTLTFEVFDKIMYLRNTSDCCGLCLCLANVNKSFSLIKYWSLKL